MEDPDRRETYIRNQQLEENDNLRLHEFYSATVELLLSSVEKKMRTFFGTI